VTEFGIVTDCRLVSPEKANAPITVTVTGIVTDVNAEHVVRPDAGIANIPLGILYVVTDVHDID
jgi:hypothetical protein